MLAASLLIGVAGVMAFRPTTTAAEATAPPTTIGAEAGDDAITPCTRASLEDRAALVLVLGLPGVTDADHPLIDRLADIGVGGVMLRDDNIVDEEQARALVIGLRERLGPDLLVAIDDEGGRVSSMGALGQSVRSARRLGAEGPVAAATAGRELGELAASLGIDWVFAPVADLDDGPADGVIGDRSFGSDPTAVAAAAGAFADGLREAGLAVTVKHFPGHGGEGDPHRGDTVAATTLEELHATHLVPFEALVRGRRRGGHGQPRHLPPRVGAAPGQPRTGRVRSCCAGSASTASRSPMRSAWARCTPASGSIRPPRWRWRPVRTRCW